MELQIHTEEALEIIKLGQLSQAEMKRYNNDHDKDILAIMKAVIGLYSGELITAAEDAKVKLDLSYGTIKNIPAALTMLYTKQHRWGYDDQRNKIVTCRTLAAYINLLIINNFELENIEAFSFAFANVSGASKPEMWADHMVLKLDNQKNSDMLPFVWAGANRIPLKIDNGFMIDITPLVEGYEKLTGDNLVDKGLTNMILTYGHPSEDVKEFLRAMAAKNS